MEPRRSASDDQSVRLSHHLLCEPSSLHCRAEAQPGCRADQSKSSLLAWQQSLRAAVAIRAEPDVAVLVLSQHIDPGYAARLLITPIRKGPSIC